MEHISQYSFEGLWHVSVSVATSHTEQALTVSGFGTQSFQGGQCIQTMLQAIWPSFKDFPNHIPASAHVTSAQMLCFFLFIIIQLPLLWLHVSKLRFLFMAKTIVMPIFGMTLFIWALVAGKSSYPIFDINSNTTFSQRIWSNFLEGNKHQGRDTSCSCLLSMRNDHNLPQSYSGFEHARFHSIRKISSPSVLDSGSWSLCPRHTLRYFGSDSHISLSRSIWRHHLESSTSLSTLGKSRSAILLGTLLGVRCDRHQHLSKLGLFLQ